MLLDDYHQIAIHIKCGPTRDLIMLHRNLLKSYTPVSLRKLGKFLLFTKRIYLYLVFCFAGEASHTAVCVKYTLRPRIICRSIFWQCNMQFQTEVNEMIQETHLDTDRGIVKVVERKVPGQKLLNGLIWLLYTKR